MAADDLWHFLMVKRLGVEALTPDQAAAAQRCAREMADMLAEHGVSLSPLVVLRAHDVLASFVDVLRLEQAASCAPAAELKEASAGAEATGKARERMRKAIKELEEACRKAGRPIDEGLADAMKPLVLRAEGVLEDALAFEQAKAERKDAEGRTTD
jgi:hypothetical protein